LPNGVDAVGAEMGGGVMFHRKEQWLNKGGNADKRGVPMPSRTTSFFRSLKKEAGSPYSRQNLQAQIQKK